MWYNEHEKSTADKRLAQVNVSGKTHRNRHLAEWRFLLFTVSVMVNLPICTVNVIGICSPPLGDVANRLSLMAMLFPAPIWGWFYSISE